MKLTNDRTLVEHLEYTRRKVTSWPSWQQKIFASKVSKKPQKPKQQPVT